MLIDANAPIWFVIALLGAGLGGGLACRTGGRMASRAYLRTLHLTFRELPAIPKRVNAVARHAVARTRWRVNRIGSARRPPALLLIPALAIATTTSATAQQVDTVPAAVAQDGPQLRVLVGGLVIAEPPVNIGANAELLLDSPNWRPWVSLMAQLHSNTWRHHDYGGSDLLGTGRVRVGFGPRPGFRIYVLAERGVGINLRHSAPDDDIGGVFGILGFGLGSSVVFDRAVASVEGVLQEHGGKGVPDNPVQGYIGLVIQYSVKRIL